MWYIYRMEIYSVIKRMKSCIYVKYHSYARKRKTNTLFSLICKIKKKKTEQINKYNRTETDLQRTNIPLPEGRGLGGGLKQMKRIKR